MITGHCADLPCSTNNVNENSNLRVQLKEPSGESLTSFKRRIWKYEYQSEKHFPSAMRASTVSAGTDSATVAQHLALHDGAHDTYPKIMEASNTCVRATKGCNVSTKGDPVDVDAMTLGRRKCRKGKAMDEWPDTDSDLGALIAGSVDTLSMNAEAPA